MEEVVFKKDVLVLAGFIVGCFSVAALGSIATAPEIQGWYSTIEKPSWNPPNWLFGPVWTALYLSMAIAGWLVWRRVGWQHSAMAWFALQLLLNLAWSFVFFKFHLPGWAFAEIVLLWIAIAATVLKFAPVSSAAAALFVPYWLWVTFAAALNFAIWRLNR